MIDLTRHIRKARQVHGDYYDYSLVNDPNIRYTDKVTIICPKHGPFVQTLNSHHRGSGCPRCGKEKNHQNRVVDTTIQLSKCKKVHDNKYDYSYVNQTKIRSHEKITIYCPDHGVFFQRLNDHINGHGCPECGSTKRVEKNKKGKDHFIEKAIQIHGDRYDYSLVLDDVGIKDKTTIICKKHGQFSQTFDAHLAGGCIQCAVQPYRSKGEQQISSLITTQFGIQVQNNARYVIPPYELDIYIPEYNLAIEYCGLFWHSESAGKGRLYHKRKQKMCEQHGIQLITIFEDEWINKKQIVTKKLQSLLGLQTDRIYARNTTISDIKQKEKKDFFDQYHIQGNGPGSITYGLYYKGELVACCSFSRKNKTEWYLTRYATKYNVIGGFSKLVKYFTDNHSWEQLISFADLRWSTGKLYEQTNWSLDKEIPPDYYYIIGSSVRKHKFGFRRKYLPNKLKHFDPQLSEKQNCDNNGLLRIWDCGKKRYVLHYR